ncbi:hypothetical protein FLONG3_7445 [Fusarium longipes]|uniref:Uncharacterized protein n=1 Tax=Fusarium longipes TaxID=694270 RepID=A0A395SD80_9HYPO|nr:hypothetical protein FLONG3_7445 [Fusarium longipes]
MAADVALKKDAITCRTHLGVQESNSCLGISLPRPTTTKRTQSPIDSLRKTSAPLHVLSNYPILITWLRTVSAVTAVTSRSANECSQPIKRAYCLQHHTRSATKSMATILADPHSEVNIEHRHDLKARSGSSDLERALGSVEQTAMVGHQGHYAVINKYEPPEFIELSDPFTQQHEKCRKYVAPGSQGQPSQQYEYPPSPGQYGQYSYPAPWWQIDHRDLSAILASNETELRHLVEAINERPPADQSTVAPALKLFLQTSIAGKTKKFSIRTMSKRSTSLSRTFSIMEILTGGELRGLPPRRTNWSNKLEPEYDTGLRFSTWSNADSKNIGKDYVEDDIDHMDITEVSMFCGVRAPAKAINIRSDAMTMTHSSCAFDDAAMSTVENDGNTQPVPAKLSTELSAALDKGSNIARDE